MILILERNFPVGWSRGTLRLAGTQRQHKQSADKHSADRQTVHRISSLGICLQVDLEGMFLTFIIETAREKDIATGFTRENTKMFQ